MDEITIDDFFKVDLRIAKVIEVSEIEEADKSFDEEKKSN